MYNLIVMNCPIYDAIVVGAGNGGLSCAAQLAKAGKKVLLLEKHNLPGGAASSFVRGRFEFEPSLHELSSVGPEDRPGPIRRMFSALEADVSFKIDPNCYRVVCTDPECSYDYTMPAGWDEFRDKLIEVDPEQKENILNLFADAKVALTTLDGLRDNKISRPALLLKHHTFLKFCSYTFEDILELYGITGKAKYVLETYWSYVGEPTGIQTAIVLFLIIKLYVQDGAAIPEHTSHQLSIALDAVIRSNGGEIYYNTFVEKILMKDGLARGVVANGKEYYAKNVVCNVNPNYVYGRMMDPECIPEKAKKLCNAREVSVSFVAVYLGLNTTADKLGIKDYTTFLETKADSNEQYKDSFCLGGEGLIIYNCLNIANPDCTPEGTCEFYITCCSYGNKWGEVEPKDYKKNKEMIADKMISLYEKTFGVDIKSHIEEITIATPVTFARYLGTPNGTPYGYRGYSWDSIIPRNVANEAERFIKNLWIVGATGEQGDGYEPAYHTGENAAKDIIKRLEGKK